MRGQACVEGAEQELATAQGGIQVDGRPAAGGVDADASARVQLLSGQVAGRVVEADPGQAKLPGGLQAVVEHVQGQLGIDLARGRLA